MKKLLKIVAALAVLGFGGFLWITNPQVPPEPNLAAHVADVENGKRLYTVGGCISCHKAADAVKDAAADAPAGGKPLPTPIGLLYPPNLTPDVETGLGHWSLGQFYTAMHDGLSPTGENLIPAFPYTSYAKLKPEDVADIWAYLQSLPPVKNAVPDQAGLMQNMMRRGLTFWKMLAFDPAQPAPQDTARSAEWNRGAYLVNGPGHCAECHTPRTAYMALDATRAFMGGPHPDGKGKVPSLHALVARERFKDKADLVAAFQGGEAMGYEHISSGGMGEVQSNLSKLPEADLNAIAEYLLSLQ
jgi:mono/diheme cytochrome c family protein